MQKDFLDYLKEVLEELYSQYLKYPTGEKIRYEVYIGDNNNLDDDEVADNYYSRLQAVKQLQEEGLILEYEINPKSYWYDYAMCLIDKKKLLEHAKVLGKTELKTEVVEVKEELPSFSAERTEDTPRPRTPYILLGDRIKITSEVDEDKKMFDDAQALSLWRALYSKFIYFDIDKDKEMFSDNDEYISVYDFTSEGRFIDNYNYIEKLFKKENKTISLVYKPTNTQVTKHIVTNREVKVLLFNNVTTDKENKYSKVDLDTIKAKLEEIIANNYVDGDKDFFGTTYGHNYIDDVYKSICNFKKTKTLSYDDFGMLNHMSNDLFLYPFFIKKSDLVQVQLHFSDYIKKYTQNELHKAIDGGSYSLRDNLIKYQFAKDTLLAMVKNGGYVEKYGDEFVLENDDIKQLVKDGIPIFHTLIALEMEGVLEIVRMKIAYWGKYVGEAKEYDVLIKINEPEKVLVSAGKTTTEPFISLKDHVVSFDDSKPHVSVNGKNCPLPLHKNEHYLCRVMFEYLVGEAIDWSEVFEKMNGFTRKPTGRNEKNDRKSVQDTMYAVNARVKEILHTKDELFAWKSNTITRNF